MWYPLIPNYGVKKSLTPNIRWRNRSEIDKWPVSSCQHAAESEKEHNFLWLPHSAASNSALSVPCCPLPGIWPVPSRLVQNPLIWGCCRRAWRGLDHQLTRELDPGSRRLHTPPRPWDVWSAHSSQSGNLFQGRSLERARCNWNHLDSVHDWAQLRLLYELLRFW